MKTLPLKLAVLMVMGTASSLMATIAPITQNFVFQWETSDGIFSPTFLDITAALGVATAPTPSMGVGITDFLITTPDGVWTPSTFTPVSGPAKTASWQTTPASTFTVSGSAADPTLTFSAGGDILTTGGNFPFMVDLETGSIITSSTPIPADVDGRDNGSWVPVLADAGVPDAVSSLMLFMVAGMGLIAYRRVQRA